MSEELTMSPLAQLESLLFVSSGPVPPSRLAKALGLTKTKIERLLVELEADYATRGIRLQRLDNGVQLISAPEAGKLIEDFLELEQFTRLSQAALEVLAVVAYEQPVTRPQVDQVRGVNSDGSLRTLLSRGLVQEVGRMETPGRPILYGTTPEFMQYFGLGELSQLPPLVTEDDGEEDSAENEAALTKIE